MLDVRAALASSVPLGSVLSHECSSVACEPNDKPWMAHLGDLDGHPDDSSTIDEVVYGRDEP